MHDTIETIGKSVIQHGQSNQRIYLTKIHADDFPHIIEGLDKLAKENNYSKIFIKIPASMKEGFNKYGFIEEAYVPGFFNGKEDALFMGKYYSENRNVDPEMQQVTEIIKLSQAKAASSIDKLHLKDYTIIQASENDAIEMSEVYKKVFVTYPFPIHNPGYLVETMKSHINYFCIRDNNRIVAISSAEMDHKNSNVEMTDFATLPEYRGKGFATYLLQRMEIEMKHQTFKTSYTIARALSAGMNITFAKLGYIYGGTLINNTNICGKLESMNVWYKHLS
jgi:putative beta-lysine N-acetyltransferase